MLQLYFHISLFVFIFRMMISSCNVGPFENQASSVTMETSKLVDGDRCNDFEIEQKLSRRVHLFYLEFSTAKVSYTFIQLA